MNRFRFRFSSVLRYRELLEDEKKREFGTALDHVRREEDSLRRIDNVIDGHENDIRGKATGIVTARQLQNQYNYSRRLDSERDEQKKQIEAAREEAEKRRLNLVEATKDRKIFERLRERDRELHEHEARREEQALIDEIAVQRFKSPRK